MQDSGRRGTYLAAAALLARTQSPGRHLAAHASITDDFAGVEHYFSLACDKLEKERLITGIDLLKPVEDDLKGLAEKFELDF
mgnify:CR=1 FL=1